MSVTRDVIIFTAIELSLGGRSPNTSTDKKIRMNGTFVFLFFASSFVILFFPCPFVILVFASSFDVSVFR